MATPSVRVVLGHSDGTNDFAPVVIVRIVLDFPRYVPKLLPMRPPSSKLEYMPLSVMLFDAIDCSAVESAIDMGEDSFIMETRNAMANGEARGSEAPSGKTFRDNFNNLLIIIAIIELSCIV